MPAELTQHQARGWRLRVPHFAIGLGLPLTVLVVTFLPTDEVYYRSVDDVVSWQNFAANMFSTLALGAAVLAWAVPRVCLWVFVGACLIGALWHAAPHETTAGVVWLIIGLLDVGLAARQAAIASSWPRQEAPPLGPSRVEPLVGLWRWESLGLFVVALVAACVCLGWWISERNDLLAFDERAVPGFATITDRDTFMDYLTATVDGKAYDFWVDDASRYRVGHDIPVRVDPRGGYPPMGPEDADPAGIDDVGPLAAPLLFLGLLFLCTPRHRDRELRRAVGDGRAVVAIVKESSTDDGFQIMTVDGHVLAAVNGMIAISEVEDDDDDSHDDLGLTIIGEGSREVVAVDLASLPPDVDLDTWLGEESPPMETSPEAGEPALVYGLERYGKPVIVETASAGHGASVTLAGRPVRDPFTVRAMLAWILKSAASHLPASGVSQAEQPVERAASTPASADGSSRPAMQRLAQSTRVIGPMAGLVALWFLTRWFRDGEDIDAFIDGAWAAFLGGTAGTFLASWYRMGRPVVKLSRFGVLLTGSVMDRLLLDARIDSVTYGRQSVTIVLKEPQERIGLIVEDGEPSVKISEIRRVMESAVARNMPRPRSWNLPSRQPSASSAIILVAAIVGLLATVLPA